MNSRIALAIIAFCLSAGAVPVEEKRSPIVRLPLKKHTIDPTSKKGPAQSNRRRYVTGSSASAPAVNTVELYTTALQIGTQTFERVIVDTGSSNTWVGADQVYVPGPSSTPWPNGAGMWVFYGSGDVFAYAFNDTVQIAGLTVQNQTIGAADLWEGFTNVDGIIGFGPTDLTRFTLSDVEYFPTIMDKLLSEGLIEEEVLGVYFAPDPTDQPIQNGEITLGGVDTSRYTGDLTYTPITSIDYYDRFFAIDVQSISYGSQVIKSDVHAAITDTGTTLIYIPDDAFTPFLAATGGTLDQDVGLVYFTTRPTENLTFNIAGTPFPLTPDQYIVPESQTSLFGLNNNNSVYWSWIANGGIEEPPSWDIVNFVIGQKFLENYYSVYDVSNSRIGFAKRT